MHITPISYNTNTNSLSSQKAPAFRHGNNFWSDNYSFKEKSVVATSTALGVLGSLLVLAKQAKCPANLKSFTSFLSRIKYDEWGKIVTIGAGSCIGGLIGGYAIDKNPVNRRAKNREAVMHFGNIAIPIITVDLITNNLLKNTNKYLKCAGAFASIFGGIYLANFIMNKVSNFIFQDKYNERGVRVTDLPAHLDDAIVAAGFISDAKPIHYLGRIIPIALMAAGTEIGCAKSM